MAPLTSSSANRKLRIINGRAKISWRKPILYGFRVALGMFGEKEIVGGCCRFEEKRIGTGVEEFRLREEEIGGRREQYKQGV